MAKYDVKMSCGHTETVELYGKSEDRQKRIKYLEKYGLCKFCYREKRNEDIKSEETANGLEPLEGSEKQVAWARSIRAKKFKEINEVFEKAKTDPLFDKLVSWLKSQKQAKWWIDRQEKSAINLAKEWKKEYEEENK